MFAAKCALRIHGLITELPSSLNHVPISLIFFFFQKSAINE